MKKNKNCTIPLALTLEYRQGLAPLREKKKIEYTSVKGKANPVSPENTASTIEFISIKKKRMK
jgi:hypothetical protein